MDRVTNRMSLTILETKLLEIIGNTGLCLFERGQFLI